MRIVLLSRVFLPSLGGIERYVEALAGWFGAHGHEVTVVTETPDATGTDHGWPYRVIRQGGHRDVLRAIRRAEVVHVVGLSLRGIGLTLAAGRRPIVKHAGHQAVCPTGLAWSTAGPCDAGPRPGPCAHCPGRGPQGSASVRAHRLGARAARHNVCISGYLRRRLGVPRPVVVYNPVFPEAFAPVPATVEDNLVAFSGRLVAEKGIDLLLRAMALLPGARLEVAGDGPLRAALARTVRELDIDRQVSFRGAVPFSDVAALYRRAAVVCVPGLWDEPYGYAAAEAMALGRPVVATPRGALVELLAEGRGFLAPDSSVAGLAGTLRAALADAPGREAAARRARQFAVTELSVDVTGARYLQLYRRALA